MDAKTRSQKDARMESSLGEHIKALTELKLTTEKLLAISNPHSLCFEELQVSMLIMFARQIEMMRESGIVGDGSSITRQHTKIPATAVNEREDNGITHDREKASVISPTTTQNEEHRERPPR